MAINPTDPSGGAKITGLQADWGTQDTTKKSNKPSSQVTVTPDLPPVVVNNDNQFTPQPMADNGSISATNRGQRFASTAMLPEGAETVLNEGRSNDTVTGAFASALDHLDPDQPVDSLDATMFSVLGSFYKAANENPDRVQALSRTVDEAFA